MTRNKSDQKVDPRFDEVVERAAKENGCTKDKVINDLRNYMEGSWKFGKINDTFPYRNIDIQIYNYGSQGSNLVRAYLDQSPPITPSVAAVQTPVIAEEPRPESTIDKVEASGFSEGLENAYKETVFAITSARHVLGEAYSERTVLESMKKFNADSKNGIVSDGPLKEYVAENITPGAEFGAAVNERYEKIQKHIESEEARLLNELDVKFEGAVAKGKDPGEILRELGRYQSMNDSKYITAKGGLRDFVKQLPPHLVQQYANSKNLSNEVQKEQSEQVKIAAVPPAAPIPDIAPLTGELLEAAQDVAEAIANMTKEPVPEVVALGAEEVQAAAGVAQASAGVAQASAGVAQPSAGVAQASAGVAQASAGVAQASAGVAQASAGVAQASAGVAQPSAGVAQPSAGVAQSSAGAAQPVQARSVPKGQNSDRIADLINKFIIEVRALVDRLPDKERTSDDVKQYYSDFQRVVIEYRSSEMGTQDFLKRQDDLLSSKQTSNQPGLLARFWEAIKTAFHSLLNNVSSILNTVKESAGASLEKGFNEDSQTLHTQTGLSPMGNSSYNQDMKDSILAVPQNTSQDSVENNRLASMSNNDNTKTAKSPSAEKASESPMGEFRRRYKDQMDTIASKEKAETGPSESPNLKPSQRMK